MAFEVKLRHIVHMTHAARPRTRLPGRIAPRQCAVALLWTLLAAPAMAYADEEVQWLSGPYSFSDELGGFTIESVSGTGTLSDPYFIRQTLYSASPVTMVIRAERPIRPFDAGSYFANGILHMRIEARNASNFGWIEFEFELQEILHQPSVFGDGLSFDQRTEDKETISSDRFAKFRRDFEPYDRLLFRDGKVDPGETVGFSFLITDYTPRTQFYLVLDPRIPFT